MQYIGGVITPVSFASVAYPVFWDSGVGGVSLSATDGLLLRATIDARSSVQIFLNGSGTPAMEFDPVHVPMTFEALIMGQTGSVRNVLTKTPGSLSGAAIPYGPVAPLSSVGAITQIKVVGSIDDNTITSWVYSLSAYKWEGS
jgi:hypothetical protein